MNTTTEHEIVTGFVLDGSFFCEDCLPLDLDQDDLETCTDFICSVCDLHFGEEQPEEQETQEESIADPMLGIILARMYNKEEAFEDMTLPQSLLVEDNALELEEEEEEEEAPKPEEPKKQSCINTTKKEIIIPDQNFYLVPIGAIGFKVENKEKTKKKSLKEMWDTYED